MAKIRQASPMKVRNSNGGKADSTYDRAKELSQKEDAVDLQILDHESSMKTEVQNDPNSQRQLRSNRKRNYKEMLEGDEVIQKTIEDE